MTNFIVAKILDEQWANKLMQGEVFMRPLRDYGVWSRQEHINDGVLDNDFRGDIGEGALDVYSDVNKAPMLQGADPEFLKVVSSARTIDYGDLQYYKVYCMYALEIENEIPKKPSDKLREFGDTAVVFIDFDAFIRRILLKHLEEDGESLLTFLGRVEYYSVFENKKLTPLFSKSNEYSWQNELRHAFARLGRPAWDKDLPLNMGRMVIDLKNKIVNVGDISDIAIKMSIDDFINLRFPDKFRARYALGSDEICINMMIHDTKEVMNNYKSSAITSQVIII